MIDIEKIAHVCHEANRALQITAGETDISPHFMDAPEWQVQSAYEGVTAALEGATPEQLHESWCRHKIENGWVYGATKDAEKKTHPCLVPYAELPADQRLKDAVFGAIVAAFKAHSSADICSFCEQEVDSVSIGSDGETKACADCMGEAYR